MKAVILCGGLGTRLRPITDTVPKVMVPINGKPILQYHIEWLVGKNICDIGINLFYLGNTVKEYFGNGSRFGARIHYSEQTELRETAGDFLPFRTFVGDDQCLIIYGDNLFTIDLEAFTSFHNAQKSITTIALRHWEDPTTKGIVGLDENNYILWFKEKPKKEEVTSHVGNAGIYLVEPEIFLHIPENKKVDFGKHIFPSLIEKAHKISGYHMDGYHIDIGTPEALEQSQKDVHTLFPNKAVFLDRDGVINKKPAEHDYVKNMDEFFWNEETKRLIKKCKEFGYLVVVITNQQGVALGKMSADFIEALHTKIALDMRDMGTSIDAVYWCPHHRDAGCGCRKPRPGLLFRASRDLGINLSKSIMIGDSDSDIEAAERAGCRGILVPSDQIDCDFLIHTIQTYEKK